MATKTAPRQAAIRPLTMTERYERSQRFQALRSVAPILITLVVLVVPFLWSLVPEQIGRVPIRKNGAAIERVFALPIPKGASFALPLGRLIRIGVAGYWLVEIFQLVSVWGMLRRQQRFPVAAADGQYFRIRVPRSLKINEQDKGTEILSNFAHRLPTRSLQRPDPCPVVLRWTGLPKAAVQQGATILGDGAFTDGVRKYLKTIGDGVEVFPHDDPLLKAVKVAKSDQAQEGEESLWLLWRDLSLAIDSAFPLLLDKDSRYLPPLLESMIPTTGIIATDVHIMLAGASGKQGKQRTRYMRESMKQELESAEIQQLTKKANSPSLTASIRLIVLADDLTAGQSTLTTMTTALTSVRSSFGMQEQGFQPGPMQSYNLYQPVPLSISPLWRVGWRILCVVAALGAVAHLVIKQAWAWPTIYWWLLPVFCLLLIPIPSLIAEGRRGYPAYWSHLAALKGIPRPTAR